MATHNLLPDSRFEQERASAAGNSVAAPGLLYLNFGLRSVKTTQVDKD
jgi:hypothetical protein